MKRARFSEEQIIGVLKEHELGAKTAENCRKHGISEANFYNWKSRYSGLETSEAKRLTEVGTLLAVAAACSPPALSPREVHRAEGSIRNGNQEAGLRLPAIELAALAM